VFVTQQIMTNPPQAYRAISKMYKRGDFYSQNSVSDIIAAHLKMLLSLEKYYHEHEDRRRQNMWIIFSLNTKRQPFPMKKPFNLLNYHRTKDWNVILIL